MNFGGNQPVKGISEKPLSEHLIAILRKQMMRSAKVVSDKEYIVVEDLPADQKEPFYDWLTGRTTPVVLEEEYNRNKWVMCAYIDDYNYWWEVVWNRDPNLFKEDKIVDFTQIVPLEDSLGNLTSEIKG